MSFSLSFHFRILLKTLEAEAARPLRRSTEISLEHLPPAAAAALDPEAAAALRLVGGFAACVFLALLSSAKLTRSRSDKQFPSNLLTR